MTILKKLLAQTQSLDYLNFNSTVNLYFEFSVHIYLSIQDFTYKFRTMSSIRKKSSKKSSVKKVLLKISQNSQENIFTRVSFVIKLQACRIFPHSDCIRRDTIRITPCLPLFIPNAGKYGRPAPLLKKRLWHRCFPVSFAKLLFLKKFL